MEKTLTRAEDGTVELGSPLEERSEHIAFTLLAEGDNPLMGLVEVFHSVQGEGFNAGRAATFVRYAGCNLDCVFADGAICDTPWQKARLKLKLTQVLAILEERWGPLVTAPKEYRNEKMKRDAPMVVVTGGEPTMAPSFDLLVTVLNRLGFYVAVETNGTRYREGLAIADWVVVSPKVHVKQGEKALDATDLERRVLSLPPNEYRWPISGPDDPAPMFLPADRTYLSPVLEADGKGLEYSQGITPKFVSGAVDRCLDIALSDPRFRISLQTHKWMLAR